MTTIRVVYAVHTFKVMDTALTDTISESTHLIA